MSKLTKWKITLLATQWLLLSAQTIPPDVIEPPLKPKPMFPMALQEILLPPKEFDHKYDGKLTVEYHSSKDIYLRCSNGNSQYRTGRMLGCTFRNFYGPDTCLVLIPTRDELEGYGWSYEIVLRHELAHCNGWSHAK